MTENDHWTQSFIKLSSALTDFNSFVLNGTGQVQVYLNTLVHIVGKPAVNKLFLTFENIMSQPNLSEKLLVQSVRKNILGDTQLGPIARNIIKLWYTGIWYQLPLSWRDAYGECEGDATLFVSAASYMEGLLWKAIAANPSGAKAPGYGSWHNPPNINFDDAWQLDPV